MHPLTGAICIKMEENSEISKMRSYGKYSKATIYRHMTRILETTKSVCLTKKKYLMQTKCLQEEMRNFLV